MDAFPPDGALVPVEVELLVSFVGEPFGDLVLRQVGALVDLPVTFEDVTEDELTWRHVRPVEPLLPDTDYVLVRIQDAWDLTTFRTGAPGPTGPEPVLLEAKSRGGGVGGGSCDTGRYLVVSFEGGVDDAAGWYETEIASDADFTDARLRTNLGRAAAFGETGCAVTLVDPPDPAFVRSRAVGADGVAGEWSEVERVGFGLVPGCAHVPSAPWTAVVLLVPLALRRRPRTRPLSGSASPT